MKHLQIRNQRNVFIRILFLFIAIFSRRHNLITANQGQGNGFIRNKTKWLQTYATSSNKNSEKCIYQYFISIQFFSRRHNLMTANQGQGNGCIRVRHNCCLYVSDSPTQTSRRSSKDVEGRFSTPDQQDNSPEHMHTKIEPYIYMNIIT